MSMETFTLTSKKQTVFILFGITGNLAKIKLIPALYDLEKKNLLPDTFHLIGIGRSDLSHDEFIKYIEEVLASENKHHKHDIKDEIKQRLLEKIEYLKGDVTDESLYKTLKGKIGHHNKMFYLATFPDLYPTIFEHVEKSGLNTGTKKGNWTRLIIEKPIGTNLKSAKEMNKLLLKYFVEDQIFRLDHYLGKETMQNILNFRFGNGIFEPLINNVHLDHVQVTAAEDFGIGERGRYYDTVGAFRDVGQNHILQMIALSLMEAPTHYTNEAITKRRIELLNNLVPYKNKIIFGQYEGYRKEKYIHEESNTDTFFAFKTGIDNERFKEVPIYVRGGKMLERTATEVALVFKHPINRIYKELEGGDEPNVLIYRIQPNEGIVLKILAKTPGHELGLTPSYMQFCYKLLSNELPDPYERLLMDALRGDQTFFIDAPEAEAQWKFSDQLSEVQGKPFMYKRGSWGPKEANKLIEKEGRKWLEPSVEFCQF
jgi:glucose-6-phosphate 1-dehydrogenase